MSQTDSLPQVVHRKRKSGTMDPHLTRGFGARPQSIPRGLPRRDGSGEDVPKSIQVLSPKSRPSRKKQDAQMGIGEGESGGGDRQEAEMMMREA